MEKYFKNDRYQMKSWLLKRGYPEKLREHRQLGFVTLNGNLAVSGWMGLAYDR